MEAPAARAAASPTAPTPVSRVIRSRRDTSGRPSSSRAVGHGNVTVVGRGDPSSAADRLVMLVSVSWRSADQPSVCPGRAKGPPDSIVIYIGLRFPAGRFLRDNALSGAGKLQLGPGWEDLAHPPQGSHCGGEPSGADGQQGDLLYLLLGHPELQRSA